MPNEEVLFRTGMILGRLSQLTLAELEAAARTPGLRPEHARAIELLADLKRKLELED